MQQRIEEKILTIRTNTVREMFLATLKKEDYNLLFRQTCSADLALDFTKFLYQNKDELKLDVNAKGLLSKKGALEVAIEGSAPETVLFLLKLKEIETDDTIIDKIDKKFGVLFRMENIANSFVSWMMKLEELKPKIEELVRNNHVKNQQINTQMETLHSTCFEQPTINENRNENLKKYFQEVNRIYKDYAQDLIQLISIFASFEETFSQYLSYSYAQEKTLSNSPSKDKCVLHRNNSQVFVDLIEGCKKANSFNFELIINRLALAFAQYYTEPAEINVSSLPGIPPMEDASPQEKPKKILINEPKTKALTNLPPQNTSLKTAPNTRLERLIGFQKQLSDLKQKGQVKSIVFLGLIKDISEEINLQCKKTKSGFLVSQGANQFSFHKAHKKDKGIDKAAVEEMKKMVVHEIISETNLNK